MLFVCRIRLERVGMDSSESIRAVPQIKKRIPKGMRRNLESSPKPVIANGPKEPTEWIFSQETHLSL